MRTGRRLAFVAGVAAAAWVFDRMAGSPIERRLRARLTGRRTVADVLEQIGPRIDASLALAFAAQGVVYPPAEAAMIATKADRKLEVWARGSTGPFVLVRTYPVLAASGGPGPKLREGDRQVPEGIYRVLSLNPNSRFHLSLELDYPNAFDRARAAEDGRTHLGGDIFVHGGAASIGCLAMGDPTVEELFVLAARVGIGAVRVVVAPQEPVGGRFPAGHGGEPPWLSDLHALILRELAAIRGLRM